MHANLDDKMAVALFKSNLPKPANKQKYKIWLADFAQKSNTFQTFPYSIGVVAAYAKSVLDDYVEFELYKYADRFSAQWLAEEHKPVLLGVTNTIWNQRLSYKIIERVKCLAPETIIVMGGPNYSDEEQVQIEFFQKHSLVDFHVHGEGEKPFTHLLAKLVEFNFDAKALKEQEIKIPGIHYYVNNTLVAGEQPPRFKDLDEIPSPYLSGLLDKFFADNLSPVMQLARGCPFQCTFCHEGLDYFNKMSRYSRQRFADELRYIAERVIDKEVTLHFADSNFGMFKQDFDTCADIREIQDTYDWPKRIDTSLGKNKIDQILSAISQLRYGTVWYSAALQSTREDVLESVRRKNISTNVLLEAAKVSSSYTRGSNSEIILNLPGDSFEAHMDTVRTVVEANISRVRMYSLLILPGSEMDSKPNREKFELKTRFRVLPRNYGVYRFGNEEFSSVEVGEMIVASNTMSFEDFINSKLFDLSVELFYNDGYFSEVRGLLNSLGISMFDFLAKCHEVVMRCDTGLQDLYDGLRLSMEKEMWESKEELLAHMDVVENLKAYEKVEFENSLASLRAVGMMRHSGDIHDVAKTALVEILQSRHVGEDSIYQYVDELLKFSRYRKHKFLETDHIFEDEFWFDFATLHKNNYDNPIECLLPTSRKFRFWHDQKISQEIARLYQGKNSPELNMRNVLFYSIAANPADYYYRSFDTIAA
jgi:radical SAM superfamily enzyme YgiQ (UPF0313 family)